MQEAAASLGTVWPLSWHSARRTLLLWQERLGRLMSVCRLGFLTLDSAQALMLTVIESGHSLLISLAMSASHTHTLTYPFLSRLMAAAFPPTHPKDHHLSASHIFWPWLEVRCRRVECSTSLAPCMFSANDIKNWPNGSAQR